MPSTTTPLEAERALVAKLRAEKESIRADYEELRLTCTDLKEINVQLSAELAESRQRYLELQERQDVMVSTWQEELEERTREFEQLRRQVLSPEELEEVRQRLMAELGSDSAERSILINQVDHYRDAYHRTRAELMALAKAADGPGGRNLEALDVELRRQQQEEIAELRQHVAMLSSQLSDPQGPAQLRRLKRELKALELRNSALLAEVDELKLAKESSTASHGQEARMLDDALRDARTQVGRFQSELEALRAQNSLLREEMAAGQLREERLRAEMHDKDTAALHAAAQAEQQLATLKAQLAEQQLQAVNQRNGWQTERAGLEEELQRTRTQVKLVQKTLEHTQGLLQDHEKTAAQAAGHRDAEDRLRRAERENQELQGKIARLEGELEKRQAMYEAEKKALEAEKRGSAEEAQRAGTDNAKLQAAVDGLQKRIRELESHQRRVHDLEEALQRAESERQVLQHRLDTEQRHKTKLSEERDIKAAEVQNMRAHIERHQDQANEEKNALHRTILQETQNFEQRERKLGDEARELADKLQQTLAMCQRQRQKYRRECKRLKELVASLEERLALEAAARGKAESETSDALNKLTELRRRVAQFKLAIENGANTAMAQGIALGPKAIPMPFPHIHVEADVHERMEDYRRAEVGGKETTETTTRRVQRRTTTTTVEEERDDS